MRGYNSCMDFILGCCLLLRNLMMPVFEQKKRFGFRGMGWLLLGLSLLGLFSSGPNGHAGLPLLPAVKPLHLALLGDTGAGTAAQKDIAQSLWQKQQTQVWQGVWLLGDNLYPDGNVIKLGNANFTAIYQSLLTAGVPFWAVLGNHDVLTKNGADELAFFKMPGRYYTKTLGPVAFFATDTNTLETQKDADQRDWLKGALDEAKADKIPWKIVLGHHPVRSSGLHGNNMGLIKTLEPLLDSEHVDLYLAGHDHDYERFDFSGLKSSHPYTQVVSGGGGAYLRPFGKVQAGSVVRNSIHHYLSLDATNQTLKLQAFKADGTRIDCLELRKPSAKALKKDAGCDTRVQP